MNRTIKMLAISGVVLLACEEPLAPKSGGLVLQVLVASGDNAALDSVVVLVRGNTNKSVKVTPGTTTTIDGLLPGSYAVALEGFAGGTVSQFGQTTGVGVKAGQNTRATVNFASFSTPLNPFPTGDSVIGKRIPVSFTAAPGAGSYLVEAATDPSFTSGVITHSVPPTATTDTIPVSVYDTFYVRVRAIDPYQGRGPASSGSIRTVPTISSVRLAFTTQPKDTVAGQAITPQVTIQDTLGRRVDSATSSVTIAIGTNPTGATLGGATTVSAVNGVATFSGLTITKAGAGYTLTATASGLTGPPSAAFTIKAGPPAKLAFTVPPPASATAGHTISPPVQLEIQDPYGNTNTGATNLVTISIRADSTGAKLKGATTEFASSGVATFSSLIVDRPDTAYRLVATSGVLTPDTSAPAAAHVTFTQLSVGLHHTCGITTDGTAYCWGANDSLQLGDSTGNLGDAACCNRSTPAPVAGGLLFSTISAGGAHTCGVSGGNAYCWGYNGNGQLGDNTATSRSYPMPVVGNHPFDSVSAGGYHSCGWRFENDAYCWGNNGQGELGNGTAGNASAIPVLVENVIFAQLSAGGFHTCGLATVGGNTWCWGFNDQQQLGVGVGPNDSFPAFVMVGLTSITAGWEHTCGVNGATNTVYCWGWNKKGQLGVGDTVNRTSPTPISGLSFSKVWSGFAHTCGLTTVGAAYCWGFDGFGELGDGGLAQQNNPVPILTGGRTFLSLTAGLQFTCGLTSTSPVAWCWGDNRRGQLGNGETNAQANALPRQVVQ